MRESWRTTVTENQAEQRAAGETTVEAVMGGGGDTLHLGREQSTTSDK